MDNSSLIQLLRNQLADSQRSDHIDLLLELTQKVIEKSAVPQQQMQLIELLEELEKLQPSIKPVFLGSSAVSSSSKNNKWDLYSKVMA